MSQELCKLCGEPMPPGEEMFFYHGYSGPCPKPPLPRPVKHERKVWAVVDRSVGEEFADYNALTVFDSEAAAREQTSIEPTDKMLTLTITWEE